MLRRHEGGEDTKAMKRTVGEMEDEMELNSLEKRRTTMSKIREESTPSRTRG